MKLRNVRRRQWDRYTDRLATISESSPQSDRPFTQPVKIIYAGYQRMDLRSNDRKLANFRNRVRRIRDKGRFHW